jgi:hypothetical protein
MRGRNTGPYSPHLEAAMACGSSGPGHRVRPRAARVAMSAGLPNGPPRVRSGGRHPVVGRTLPSGAADRRGHQHGYRPQPGHVCRTPSVRTAVIPEAADGQSADHSDSLQRPLLFLKASLLAPPAVAALGRYDTTDVSRKRPTLSPGYHHDQRPIQRALRHERWICSRYFLSCSRSCSSTTLPRTCGRA